MTPRVGVKTTLTMERAFSGLPVPSGSPTFFVPAICCLLLISARFSCNADSVDVEGFERSMIAQDCSTVRAEVD